MKCKIEIAIDDAKSGKITDMHGVATRNTHVEHIEAAKPPEPESSSRSQFRRDRQWAYGSIK